MSSTKPFYIGLITLLLICCTSVLIIWQSDILQKMSGYELSGRFGDIGGLIKGADIRYRGYSVGRVVSIHPTPTHIDVNFWVNGGIDIPKGSTIKILFDGLVGENYIGIFANPNSEAMVSQGDVLFGKSGSDLAQFIDLGSQNLVHTEAILNNMRRLLTDESLVNNTIQSLQNIERITAKLALFTDSISADQSSKFFQLISNLEAITSSGAKITDELARPEVLSGMSDMAINLQKMSAELLKTSEASKELLSEDNLKNLQETLAHINSLSSKLDVLIAPRKEGRPHLLSTLSSLSLSNQTGVYTSPGLSKQYFESEFEFALGAYSLMTSVSDFGGETEVNNFQQAYYFTDRLRSRIGVFYSEPGLGLDYWLTRNLSVGLNYYDFENGYYILSTAYQFYPHLSVQTMLRNDNASKDSDLNLGLKYNF